MNTCRVLFCLLLGVTLVVGTRWTVHDGARQDEVNMLFNSLPKLRSMMPFANEDVCNPEVTSCSDDKLTVCAFGMANVTIPCSSIFDGKTGYCDCEKVGCTATRPNCYKPNPKMCRKEGKMPDPSDCRKFTYCGGKTVKSLTCPAGMTYNPEKEACETGFVCQSVTCNPKKLFEFLPFPHSPKYYLLCYLGVGEVRQCSQAGYSMQDGKCQFQCRVPGLFQDPKDENHRNGMWHSCVWSKNKVLVRVTNHCERDGDVQLVFNEEKGLCLPDDSGAGTTSSQSPNQ